MSYTFYKIFAKKNRHISPERIKRANNLSLHSNDHKNTLACFLYQTILF